MGAFVLDAAGALRLGALAGGLGPLVFLAAAIFSSLLQNDYSWRHEYISGLSAHTAQHPWVMIAGFVLAGGSTVPLAWCLHRGIHSGWGSGAGPLMLALAGVGLAAVGLLPNDCSDALASCKAQLEQEKSWHSAAHDLVSIPTFFCLVVGPLTLAVRMLADPRWRRLGRFTFALFPVVAAVMVVDGLEISDGWGGLVQRTHILLLVLWTELVSVHMFRLAGHFERPGRWSPR